VICRFRRFVGSEKLASNVRAGRRRLASRGGEFARDSMDLRGAQTFLGLLAASKTDSQNKKKNDLRQQTRETMCVWIVTRTKSAGGL
jgi:hypothetical protein